MKMDNEELKDNFDKKIRKYFLVNVIAKRARALIDGERPLVDIHENLRPSEIAIKEIREGKIKVLPKAVRNKLVDIVREVTDRS